MERVFTESSLVPIPGESKKYKVHILCTFIAYFKCYMIVSCMQLQFKLVTCSRLIIGLLFASFRQVLIGNRKWMVRNGIDVTPDIEEQIVHHEERGQTVVIAAINSEGS